MAFTHPNGRVPSSALVRLDTGAGRHLSTPRSALKWYLLRRNVKARTGVDLYITPGMNGYRDYAEQEIGKASACAQGNCAAAASAGWSSHGGNMAYAFTNWIRVDAMAYDIGNYWAIPWAVFKEEAEKVGFEVGLITRAIAGIEEPWHIIDRDRPFAPVADLEAAFGVKLVRGADGVYRMEDDDMLDANRDYPAFVTMLQRALRYDARPDGVGATYTLGPTVFELLRAADDSADVKAVSVAITDEDRAAIAALVAEKIVGATPSPGGASPAEITAAVKAGLAGLTLTASTS